jgi:hypothetical protein
LSSGRLACRRRGRSAAWCQFDDSILLTNGFSDDEQSVYRLVARGAAVALFELCSLHVARACMRAIRVETFLRELHHAIATRGRHVSSSVASHARNGVGPSRDEPPKCIFTEMRSSVRRHCRLIWIETSIPNRPDVMQHCGAHS